MDRSLFSREQTPRTVGADLTVLAKRLSEITKIKRKILDCSIEASNLWQSTKDAVLEALQKNEGQVISLEDFTAKIVAKKKRSPLTPANFIWTKYEAVLQPGKYMVGAVGKYYDTDVVLLAAADNLEIWFGVAIDSFCPVSASEAENSRPALHGNVIE